MYQESFVGERVTCAPRYVNRFVYGRVLATFLLLEKFSYIDH